MKSRLLFCALLSCLLTGCISFNFTDDDITASNYEAQIMQRDVFENAVQLMPAQDVEKSGKIYISGQLMIVNDVNRGFHIYNYSNPQLPIPVAFLQIPGATDVAMRGATMYINQAVDLVTIQYNTAANTISITDRSENVFPQKIAPDNSYANVGENEIIVNWVPKN